MNIIEKAKELGELIADSPEMERLNMAEVSIQMDEKSNNLLNEYKLIQMEMIKVNKDGQNPEEIEKISEKLLNKEKELTEYEVTKEFFDSKMEFDLFMKKINDAIVHAITGEENCTATDCGTCESNCKQ